MKQKKDIHRNLFDHIIKDQSIMELNGLFEFLGIDIRVTEKIVTEHTTILQGESRADGAYKTNQKFQIALENSLNAAEYDDDVRHVGYGYNIYDYLRRMTPEESKWKDKENYTPVMLIHISGSKINRKVSFVQFIFGYPVPVYHYTLLDIDGNEYLNNLRYKVKSNKPLNYVDVAFLKLFNHTKITGKLHDLLIELYGIVYKDLSLPLDIKVKILNIYKVINNKYVDKKYRKKLVEIFSMNEIQEMYDEMIREEARQEWNAEIWDIINNSKSSDELKSKLIKSLSSK